MPQITLKGMENAEKQLARIERGVAALASYKAILFSRQPYAWGQNYGHHRVSGKLARRAGGTEYMERAVRGVMGGADADISAGLSKVTAPGVWVLRRLVRWAHRLAKEYAPRRSGRLRSTIRIRVGPR